MMHSDVSYSQPFAVSANRALCATVGLALGWFVGYKQGYDSGVLVGYAQCLEKLTRAAMTAVGR